MADKWNKAHEWETEWWGNCVNTLNEELKQSTYAKYMGINRVPDAKTPYRYETDEINILDIGSGPTSLMLKCEGFKRGFAIDPIDMPKWVRERYRVAGIKFVQSKGEEIPWDDIWQVDEVWIYNVLQHTDNPEKIIKDALKHSALIRVFEWIETDTNDGHPHTFTAEQYDKLFKGKGKVVNLSENGCYGKAYCGIFKGEKYNGLTD